MKIKSNCTLYGICLYTTVICGVYGMKARNRGKQIDEYIYI